MITKNTASRFGHAINCQQQAYEKGLLSLLMTCRLYKGMNTTACDVVKYLYTTNISSVTFLDLMVKMHGLENMTNQRHCNIL